VREKNALKSDLLYFKQLKTTPNSSSKMAAYSSSCHEMEEVQNQTPTKEDLMDVML